ncbi:GNAT family N-acetyltransferase [Nocardioides sp.]|uniref:GNAT family N-acetyltransferase n=1 Tax=Nocardioides sp. TaxID=35761 RepID=UPI00271C0EB5|nr:GNAT family N-acetyltransferase [Nocardioides sp.]MDO9454909.1 GNAT family N-acetyltransferase [Nocardioides sp.]
MVTPTAHLTADDLRQVRDLMDTAFDDFTDHDWSHALGGLHVLVRDEGDQVVAHGALVQRRLLVDGRSLSSGYVEAVAVHPAHCRQGFGSRVMADLETLAPGYDLLALSSSTAGVPFYEARGWELWRGPSAVVSPEGLQPTPEEDGAIYVLGGTGLDLDAPIACDWRDGDVW